MTANVLSCSKSRSLMIRGVLNDLITRPATNAARALQQFSHCDGYRLSDGALLFVPGRCRTASTGRRRSGARYQREISWIDQRHAVGGGADGDDGRQAYRGGARRDFAMGPRRCNGRWLRENRAHSHTKVRDLPQCSVWDADFASHQLRRGTKDHHTGYRIKPAPVGQGVAYPSFRYQYDVRPDWSDLQLECDTHLVPRSRYRHSLPGNYYGYRILVGNQVLRSGVRVYRTHRRGVHGLGHGLSDSRFTLG